MKIAGIEYDFSSRAIELYVSGCTVGCPGCHNPELWGFNRGDIWQAVLNRCSPSLSCSLFDRIWIMGGEPLDQERKEMLDMIYALKLFNKKLWLWTSYELQDVANELNTGHFEYVKTGAYIQELPVKIVKAGNLDITLASSNQELHTVE